MRLLWLFYCFMYTQTSGFCCVYVQLCTYSNYCKGSELQGLCTRGRQRTIIVSRVCDLKMKTKRFVYVAENTVFVQ